MAQPEACDKSAPGCEPSSDLRGGAASILVLVEKDKECKCFQLHTTTHGSVAPS